MAAKTRNRNSSKASVRMTFRLDEQTATILADLARRWGCTPSEADRRAIQQAADAADALRPVTDALARLEARIAACGGIGAGDIRITAEVQRADAVKATTAVLAGWGDDD